MSPQKARIIESGLLRKGFTLRRGKDIYFHLHVNNFKTKIWTKISRGEKEIHHGLLCTMARQLKLTQREFIDLVKCPLEYDDYLAKLRASDHIE